MKRKFIFIVLLKIFILFPLIATSAEPMYVMHLSENWEIEGDLPEHALLISLQGVANQGTPRLYFLYPADWNYTFCEPLLYYYQQSRQMQFQELTSVETALELLKDFASGYVVWDKSVRTSLIVAFTAAGLNQAVLVSEELIPLAEKFGLQPKADFRGTFQGMSDYEIYEWAFEKYWEQCNHDYLVYLGGECGKIMKPGIADFGIYQRAFFTDASTDPADTLEYNFAKKIFSHLPPMSMVMGWHSYCKDKEAQHVTLTSNYALRVEGLHTLPNMSFNTQIPLSTGYQFKNNHHLHPDSTYLPQKKTYVACIQTDCLGIGAWTKPGRGDIPYAWEVTMNWLWLAPAMMQYFYDMATPNDYFIGALSGPGYMYPKAIPPQHLPAVIQKAYDLMQQLDLNVFEIMEHSNYWLTDGIDDDLPKKVVDAYYQGMPKVIGFVNGYRPAHTFTVRGKKPFISYDYYLSESRDEQEATLDLMELANLNDRRPYFLLLHVRNWSDINRVKRILDRLGPEFELTHLDVFLKMAGNQPTFTERYGD